MRRLTLPALVLGVVFGIGCAGTTYGTVSSGYGYDGYGYYDDGYYGQPSLSYISPGVQVVAGYDHPVFYSNNFYWRYHNDRWFRSPYWNRGWVYATPPRAIARIDRPYRYRNYRPHNYSVRRDQRSYQRPYYRDDRGYRQAPVRGGGYRQAPVRGDYRQAPVRGGGYRQAPVRGGGYRQAPVQRQRAAPVRSDADRIRSIRDQRTR